MPDLGPLSPRCTAASEQETVAGVRPAKPDIFPFANSGPLKNWWTQSEEFLVLGEWEGEDLGPPETSTPFLYQILSTCLCGGSFFTNDDAYPTNDGIPPALRNRSR